MIGWGVSASILVHGILALLLIFGFPLTLPAEPRDDSVSVEIVDPPEAEKPEEEKPEDKRAEGMKPGEKTPPVGKKQGEEARPPEKQARMTPAQTQQAEDARDPTTGATPPGAESQAFESVPQDAGQAKDKAVPDETATTRTGEKPTTARTKAAEVSQRQLSKADLDAVKEAMRQAAEEKAAEQAKAEAQKAEQAKAEAAAILAARQAAAADAAAAADTAAAAEIAKASVPDKAEGDTPVETATAIGPEKAASQTGDAAAATEVMPDDASFSQAKELFSKQSLRDPRVKKALGKLPPNRRLVQICTIEALEQVRHASPDALPEGMVPFAERGGLIAGPKLAASGGAYFSQGNWYGIDFSCETNADVTEITAFRYDMTGAIPRGEWKSRKLPAP